MKIIKLIAILPFVLLTGCLQTEELKPIDEPDLLSAGPVVVESEDALKEDQPKIITVFVCGEVNNPGVYELPGGSRVCDALSLAGDFTEEADIDYLNLAAELSDGQKVYIPGETETVSEALLEERGSDDPSGLVNINTADASKLKTLPGIGDVKANAIIAYREEHGGYTSIEQIKQVDGIKSGLYDNIKDKITVN